MFTRLIFAAYFLEAGLILVVAPWSGFWERNFFLQGEAVSLLANPFLRGAISGIGVITVVAGLAELGGAFSRRHERSSPPEQSPPA